MAEQELDRLDVVAQLLKDRGDSLVVTGLGSSTYDVSAQGDNHRNFYLWGAMGGAAAIGLGLALAQPDTPVIVITGDGEMLMGTGSMATIAKQAPGNLKVIVLDNGHYGETGMQEAHTNSVTDLTTMAKGAGIEQSSTIVDQAGVDRLVDSIKRLENAPTFAVIKVSAKSYLRADTVAKTIKDGAYNRARVRVALGVGIE
jgi:thiamine pyrophosphate-dependent acetolactate synthase large subunit-like protein